MMPRKNRANSQMQREGRKASSLLVLSLTLLIIGGLLFGLSGCFMGRNTETKFYLLDYVPTPPKERLDKGYYPYVLRVKDPTIAEAYGRAQIVYRQNAHQMQFYGYHLWAVDPERMVGDLLVKHLRAARLFQNVTRSVENYQPDYVMNCEVQAIEEYDYQDQWFAHLAVEYSLEEGKTGQVVWKKNFDLRHKVAQQEPVYVVRELSALLESIHTRVVSELDIVLDEAKYRDLSNAQMEVGKAGRADDSAGRK